jgi:hypothetical protein
MTNDQQHGDPRPVSAEFRADVERALTTVAGNAERLVDTIAPPADRELIRRAIDLSPEKQARLVRRLWSDERIRLRTRLPMIAGLVFALVPFPIVPRRLGALRRWEKLIGLGLILWLVTRLTPAEVLREHLEAVERDNLLRRFFRRSDSA